MTPKRLRARWDMSWQLVWIRDDPYHKDAGRALFNLETGEVLWVLDDALSAPEGPLEEIEPLQHGVHHEIFRSWLRTVPLEQTTLCNTESIGHFFKTAEFHFGSEDAQELRWAWNGFHDDALRAKAEEWLRARGWEVEWVD